MKRRLAGLGLFAVLVVVAEALTIDFVRQHAAAQKVAHTALQRGVSLSESLSLREQRGGVVALVVALSVTNSGDDAVPYIGLACFDPVTVIFRSKLPYPAGPPYGPSAAALRTRIMEFRRTRDEVGSFSDDPATSGATNLPCDKTGVPLLAPHTTLRYQQSDGIAVPGENFVDAATTDVVATVQLAQFPPGADLTELMPTQAIEVSSPLSSVSSGGRQSIADYQATSARFDAVMANADVAAWVNAQVPVLWKDARLDGGDYGMPWTLSAFNAAWAVPLVVKGDGAQVSSVRIPAERRTRTPSIHAKLPPDVVSASDSYVPVDDYYVGDLVLPSGRIMVGDPVLSDGMLTFDYRLRPGRYPVHLVTARPRYLGQDWTRDAWETLALTNEPVIRWEPAIPVGHTKAELKPGYVFEWGTDGGEGGMASPEAMKLMDQSIVGDMTLYDEIGERQEANDWLFAMTTVEPRSGANVFACASGFGDGGYPVFLGLDARGRPAMLLSDFGVLQMSYSGY
jgi:hypothetical protein